MARYILIAEAAKRLLEQGFGHDEAWRRARLLDDFTQEECRVKAPEPNEMDFGMERDILNRGYSRLR